MGFLVRNSGDAPSSLNKLTGTTSGTMPKCAHQFGQETYTPKRSNMLGTQRNRSRGNLWQGKGLGE